ncbi:MAG: carbohydrate ABC transporter permease [Treponemataceae bacterium]|nr:carbohydrate ABC transporter permease [Treponemataceae bacterium]
MGKPYREKSSDIIKRAILYLVFWVFTFLTIYPLFWLVISSLKTTQAFQMDRLGLPNPIFWGNYPMAWKIGKFDILFKNSVFYTVTTTIAVLILSFMAGFAFAKIKNRFTPLLYRLFVIGILLTLQSIMVPLFLMTNAVGLYNTRIGILIPYIAIGLPMGVYLGTEYIKSIPDAIIESARIDGASYIKIFWAIVAPMTKPVAITLSIISFTGIWNEFMLINILASKESIKSLPVGILKFSGALATDYGKQFAALSIGMIPMLVFYLIFRKQITQGVSAGAVKG